MTVSALFRRHQVMSCHGVHPMALRFNAVRNYDKKFRRHRNGGVVSVPAKTVVEQGSLQLNAFHYWQRGEVM